MKITHKLFGIVGLVLIYIVSLGGCCGGSAPAGETVIVGESEKDEYADSFNFEDDNDGYAKILALKEKLIGADVFRDGNVYCIMDYDEETDYYTLVYRSQSCAFKVKRENIVIIFQKIQLYQTNKLTYQEYETN